MRPYWKGYLKLALVSCPIALHAACSTAERIAFRQINKATGNRLRQQLVPAIIGKIGRRFALHDQFFESHAMDEARSRGARKSFSSAESH
jgi:hypothetical protein